MFRMYFYEGTQIRGKDGEELVRQAAVSFCRERGMELKDEEQLTILRAPGGKPYFPNLAAEFNVSHSGIMWVCLMGDTACGVDIQTIKDCEYTKIAGRYFSRQEQSFIFKHGEEGFFRLWVRREAFGKYTGQGFFGENMPIFVDEEGRLRERLETDGKTVFLREIEIAPHIKCAYCTEEEKDDLRILG